MGHILAVKIMTDTLTLELFNKVVDHLEEKSIKHCYLCGSEHIDYYLFSLDGYKGVCKECVLK